jgi:hypothetical protein
MIGTWEWMFTIWMASTVVLGTKRGAMAEALEGEEG